MDVFNKRKEREANRTAHMENRSNSSNRSKKASMKYDSVPANRMDREPFSGPSEDVDEAYHPEYFKHFSNYIYKHRGIESNSSDIWPYRYGSYLIYEANNLTKNFKVATFINLTS
jgi:hypothetical protein